MRPQTREPSFLAGPGSARSIRRRRSYELWARGVQGEGFVAQGARFLRSAGRLPSPRQAAAGEGPLARLAGVGPEPSKEDFGLGDVPPSEQGIAPRGAGLGGAGVQAYRLARGGVGEGCIADGEGGTGPPGEEASAQPGRKVRGAGGNLEEVEGYARAAFGECDPRAKEDPQGGFGRGLGALAQQPAGVLEPALGNEGFGVRGKARLDPGGHGLGGSEEGAQGLEPVGRRPAPVRSCVVGVGKRREVEQEDESVRQRQEVRGAHIAGAQSAGGKGGGQGEAQHQENGVDERAGEGDDGVPESREPLRPGTDADLSANRIAAQVDAEAAQATGKERRPVAQGGAVDAESQREGDQPVSNLVGGDGEAVRAEEDEAQARELGDLPEGREDSGEQPREQQPGADREPVPELATLAPLPAEGAEPAGRRAQVGVVGTEGTFVASRDSALVATDQSSSSPPSSSSSSSPARRRS